MTDTAERLVRQLHRRQHVRWLMAGACHSSAVLDRVLGSVKRVTLPVSKSRH